MPALREKRENGKRSYRTLWNALVFSLCSWPLLALGFDAWRQKLTANPVSEVMNRLGFFTLTLLLLSLAATPLKTLFGWTYPLRVRRMVGLFAFLYGVLHFSVYLALDQGFDLADIGRDIVKRKFITVGFLALVVLIPLALTSTDAWVRRLGFRRWKRIHRLAYLAGVLGVVHFIWRVKADYREPAIFAAVLAVLFAVRIFAWWTKRTKGGTSGARAPAHNVPDVRSS